MVEALTHADVRIVACLPDSLLRSTYRRLAEDPVVRLVRVSNEADLPGIVVGAHLGGTRAVMMMENSGVRQACEPLARFAFSHHFPIVMIVTLRGDFPEPTWWGHAHAQTMSPVLDALRIPQRLIERPEQLKASIAGAFTHARSSQWPVALVLAGDCLER
jgi:sulfopyruvate decarboxylase subunit alpha